MLSVVLTILKFVGITILVLLGILLFIICLVLFVPICYKADGFYKDSYRVRAKVSWLLHIVSFSLFYEKEQPFQMKLRIFGIPVFDNLQKKEKEKGKKSKKHTRVKEETTPEIVASSIPEKNVEVVSKQEATKMEDAKTDKISSEKQETAKVTEKEKIKRNRNKISLWQRIKNIFSKLTGFFRNIKYTFQKICDTIKSIKDNITYYVELLQKDSTKAAIAACKKQLLRIFKNLKPQKYQVNLHIGMEDPAPMGDILGVWGMLYPIHVGHVDLCPDFEQAVFEGEFYCKGRVTVYVYIWTLMIILFDKNIRHLRKCLVREGK